jgi:hypothetical protein
MTRGCAHDRTGPAYVLVPARDSPTGKRTQARIGRYCHNCQHLLPTKS